MNALARLALAHPRAALAAALAATLLFAAGIPRLETDAGYRAFLGAGHPAVRRFDAFLERYEGGLPLALVYACEGSAPCASVFDPEALAMARDVSGALARAPGVRRAESPATATILVPAPPPFPPRPRRFFEHGALAPDRAALAARALGDRLWHGSLVSEDGRTGAIVVEIAGSGGETAASVWGAAERAIAPFEARGFRFHAVGGPVEFVVAGGELERAARRLVPLMVGLVALGLAALLRSPGATAALLAAIGLAVVWTHGLLGWLGFAQSTLTQILAPIVLVTGACNGLHLVARFAAARAEGDPSDLAAKLGRAAGEVGTPCLMMSLTTAGGFLSFATCDLEAFVRFGFAAAFGVLASLALSFGVLPVLLLHLPPRRAPERRSGTLEDALVRLARGVGRRAGAVLALSALAGVLAVAGISRLRVDASFEDLYGERSRVVAWAAFVRDRLRKPDTLEVELASPPGTDLASPESLAVVERAAARLAALEGAGRARSILDPLGWMRRLLSGDDPRLERPGESSRANRLLLDLLARDPSRPAARWLDEKGGRFRVSLETEKAPQDRLRALVAGAEHALRSELPPGWSFSLTGPAALVREMLDAIARAQRTSFVQAWATVALLVALFLRSARAGLLVTVPTVLPVAATLGAMGLLGLPLDPGSAMVAAVVLGLSDDDAIHLLAQHRRLRELGATAPEAIEGALAHAGRAIVTSSLALALGFSTLALSPWKSVASFGLLSALAILSALGAVLVVLPAVLYGAARLGASGSGSSSAPRSSR